MKIVLICGACRSGTTALQRVFLEAGICCLFQPMKTMRRLTYAALPSELAMFNDETINRYCVKETFGPYFDFEIEFDPARIIKSVAGNDVEIFALVTLVNPVVLQERWKRAFSNRNGIDDNIITLNIAKVYNHLNRLVGSWRDLCDRIVLIDQGSATSESVTNAITPAFDFIGVAFSQRFFDWSGPCSRRIWSRLVKWEEPHHFYVPALLDDVKFGDRYSFNYQDRSGDCTPAMQSAYASYLGLLSSSF
jgi:hypothetical protein